METQEIKVNEEVIDVTEDITETGTGKGLMFAAGIGLAVLAGGIAYKYIAKPMAAKLKARKEEQTEEVEDFDDDVVEAEILEETVEESKETKK